MSSWQLQNTPACLSVCASVCLLTLLHHFLQTVDHRDLSLMDTPTFLTWGSKCDHGLQGQGHSVKAV